MLETLIRIVFILTCGALAAILSPFAFSVQPVWAGYLLHGGIGAVIGALAVAAEWRLRKVPMRILVGTMTGALAGSLLGFILLRFVAPGGGGDYDDNGRRNRVDATRRTLTQSR